MDFAKFRGRLTAIYLDLRLSGVDERATYSRLRSLVNEIEEKGLRD